MQDQISFYQESRRVKELESQKSINSKSSGKAFKIFINLDIEDSKTSKDIEQQLIKTLVTESVGDDGEKVNIINELSSMMDELSKKNSSTGNEDI